MLFGDTTARYLPDAFSYVDEICVLSFVLIGLVRWRPLTREAHLTLARWGRGRLLRGAIASSLLHAVPLSISVPGIRPRGVKGIAFFYLVSWVDHRPEDIRAYGQVIAGVTVVVLSFAVIELLAPSVIPQLGLNPRFGPREMPSLKGPFIQPVHFSWFCAFRCGVRLLRFAIVRGWWALALGMASSLG